MFGIRITSVFTWHFVYLTVLFFFLLFSSTVAIMGWMSRSLLREADDRAVRLWDGGEKKEVFQMWTTSTLQSVWSWGSLMRSALCPFPPFFSGCFFFFFLMMPLIIPVVWWHHLLRLQTMVNWLRIQTFSWCHEATQTEASWGARRSRLPACRDAKSQYYFRLYWGGA